MKSVPSFNCRSMKLLCEILAYRTTSRIDKIFFYRPANHRRSHNAYYRSMAASSRGREWQSASRPFSSPAFSTRSNRLNYKNGCALSTVENLKKNRQNERNLLSINEVHRPWRITDLGRKLEDLTIHSVVKIGYEYKFDRSRNWYHHIFFAVSVIIVHDFFHAIRFLDAYICSGD